LREFAKAAKSDTAQNVANAIVPLIVVAEPAPSTRSSP